MQILHLCLDGVFCLQRSKQVGLLLSDYIFGNFYVTHNFFHLQYLELRYNSRVVRLFASFSYMISIILYMGVVLYAPCLALHTITGLPVVALILLGGIVATIYTVMVS